MILDSAYGYAEIRCDVLAGVAGKDQLQDLALTRSEPRDAIRRILRPGESLLKTCCCSINLSL